MWTIFWLFAVKGAALALMDMHDRVEEDEYPPDDYDYY